MEKSTHHLRVFSNLISRWNFSCSVSSTPCHGAWTPAPLSAHLSIECRCTTPEFETPIFTRRTTTHQFIWQQQHTVRAAHWADYQWKAEWADNTVFSPSQEQPGSNLTASAPVSGLFPSICTNGVWPPVRPVSVVQKNKPLTTLSSNVYSIDLMDCTAWRYWRMRQSNGCSTPVPRSSAAKQWLQERLKRRKSHWCFLTVENWYKAPVKTLENLFRRGPWPLRPNSGCASAYIVS